MADNGNGNGGLSKLVVGVLGTLITAAIMASVGVNIRSYASQGAMDEKIANIVQANSEMRSRIVALEQERLLMNVELVRLQARIQRLEERR